MLTNNKMHFKAPTEGYKAAAGRRKVSVELRLQPAEIGRTLNEAASAVV